MKRALLAMLGICDRSKLIEFRSINSDARIFSSQEDSIAVLLSANLKAFI